MSACIYCVCPRSKFRNIEETEMAKQRILEESRSKKTEGASLLPTNMAADFMHHNRCKHKCDNKLADIKLLFLFSVFQDKPRTSGSANKPDQSRSDAKRPKLTVGSLDERNPLAPTLKEDAVLDIPVAAGPKKPKRSDLATDDYHFEKFKRKSRKKY